MSTPRPVLLSWSSGKDSAFALHVLRQDPEVQVVGLLTSCVEQTGRVSMHDVRPELVSAQAAAARLPLWRVSLPWPCPNEVYEARMADVTRRVLASGIDAIAFGDLFLEDIRAYREQQLAGSGLEPLFPLWGRDTRELAREMVAAGQRATIVTIDRSRCENGVLGAEFDPALLDALPESVDPCAERGEFHTFATAGPAFEHPIEVARGASTERNGFAYLDLRLRERKVPRVELLDFEPEHLPLLERWLDEPTTVEFWGPPAEPLQVARDLPDGAAQAVISANGEPVGYLRWTRCERALLDSLGFEDLPDGAIDIDLLIGAEHQRGRGIGPRALELLGQRLEGAGAEALGLVTSRRNHRAHAAFAKAGWTCDRAFEDETFGPCWLFLRRPVGQREDPPR